MKRILLILVVVSAAALLAWGQVPVLVFEDDSSSDQGMGIDPSGFEVVSLVRPFTFVGVTSQTFDGDSGYYAMTTACSNEYPRSRMALTQELFTAIAPPPIVSEAWILPTPTFALTLNDGATFSKVMDVSGTLLGNAQEINCISWTRDDAGIEGTIVDSTGAILKGNCNQARPVACAARQ